MAEKTLIIERNEWEDGQKGMTQLVGNVKDETLYAEYLSFVNGKLEHDTIELSVNVEDMIKIRDFLTNVINKVAKGYPHEEDYYGNATEIQMEGE